jgi:hypothetical protein
VGRIRGGAGAVVVGNLHDLTGRPGSKKRPASIPEALYIFKLRGGAVVVNGQGPAEYVISAVAVLAEKKPILQGLFFPGSGFRIRRHPQTVAGKLPATAPRIYEAVGDISPLDIAIQVDKLHHITRRDDLSGSGARGQKHDGAVVLPLDKFKSSGVVDVE